MSNNIRYVGLDVHKSYVMAAAVNADQQVVLKPRRIDRDCGIGVCGSSTTAKPD